MKAQYAVGKWFDFPHTHTHTHAQMRSPTLRLPSHDGYVIVNYLSIAVSTFFFLLPPALLLRLRLGMETMYAAWEKLTRRTMVMVFFCCCYFQWKMDGKLKHTVRHSERARAPNSTVLLTQYD